MAENGKYWFDLNRRDRRKVVLFMVCLACAIVLWLISSFSKRHLFSANVELLLTNVPTNKTLNIKNIEEVTLQVEGTGWQFLFSKIDLFKRPLKLDISKVKEESIQLMTYVETLNSQLPQGLKIRAIQPERIDLDFSSRVVKKVPLELSADITFKKQYFYSSDLILSPDSITISGPFDKVSKIKVWKTPRLVFANLSDSVSSIIRLEERNVENIRISPSVVTLKIPVEKYTEGSIEIALNLLNSDRYDVNLLPGKIRLKYLCPVSKFSQIDADMFYAQVDLNQWKLGHKSKLDVKLLRSPDFVRIIRIEPQIVDFLVSK